MTPSVHRLPQYAVIMAALALSACTGVGPSTPAGPDQHESRSVELDKSERVRVELNMGAGTLDVQGGATNLLDADFTYNVPAFKPTLRYTAGSPSDLVLEQPSSTATGNTKNQWNLKFNDKVPVDFKLRFGAGEAKLNLGSLALRGMDVEFGAGTLNLDLRGTPAKDYSVHIQGGVGKATVYLPKNVGISAKATGGLGEISVEGLHKNGDVYVNDASETAKVKVRLDIQGGVGSIKLIAG